MPALLSFGMILGLTGVIFGFYTENKKLKKRLSQKDEITDSLITSTVESMIKANYDEVKIIKYVREEKPELGLVEAKTFVDNIKYSHVQWISK